MSVSWVGLGAYLIKFLVTILGACTPAPTKLAPVIKIPLIASTHTMQIRKANIKKVVSPRSFRTLAYALQHTLHTFKYPLLC